MTTPDPLRKFGSQFSMTGVDSKETLSEWRSATS
jgi:hypothetical protein